MTEVTAPDTALRAYHFKCAQRRNPNRGAAVLVAMGVGWLVVAGKIESVDASGKASDILAHLGTQRPQATKIMAAAAGSPAVVPRHHRFRLRTLSVGVLLRWVRSCGVECR